MPGVLLTTRWVCVRASLSVRSVCRSAGLRRSASTTTARLRLWWRTPTRRGCQRESAGCSDSSQTGTPYRSSQAGRSKSCASGCRRAATLLAIALERLFYFLLSGCSCHVLSGCCLSRPIANAHPGAWMLDPSRTACAFHSRLTLSLTSSFSPLLPLPLRSPVSFTRSLPFRYLPARLSVEGLYFAGSHGFEISGPDGCATARTLALHTSAYLLAHITCSRLGIRPSSGHFRPCKSLQYGFPRPRNTPASFEASA
eukprot:6181321-Pleurochrysis_carterae.AAC.4